MKDNDTTLRLDEYMPYRLAVASSAVSNLVASGYDRLYGLKIPEWRLIAVLHESGPSPQQALVSRTGMDKVTISRAAETLARRKLITRMPHEHDGRSHHLILTEQGERLFANVAPVAMEFERVVLSEFTADEVTVLKILLLRIEQAAQQALSNDERKS